MDLLKDPVLKTRYLKNKIRIKGWERDFMEKYGRKPNKVGYNVVHFFIFFFTFGMKCSYLISFELEYEN